MEAAVRFGLRRWQEAQDAALRAQLSAQDATDEALIQRLIENLELRLDAPTNDSIGRQQFRIAAMDIDQAREMIDAPKKVVVAVIDA